MARRAMRIKAARKPKFMTRTVRRCRVCGRPRSVLRKFGSAASVSARTLALGLHARAFRRRRGGDDDERPAIRSATSCTRLRNGMRRGPRPRGRAGLAPEGEPSLKVLEEEGYVASFRKVEETGRPLLRVGLKYDHEGEPIVTGLERVSRPGRRVYAKAEEIPEVLGGLGVSIVSTSQGIVTGQEGPARRGSAAKSSATSGEESEPVSRVGKMPVVIPKGVEVKADGGDRARQGPQGGARRARFPPGLTVVDRGRRGPDRARERRAARSARSTGCCAASSPTPSRASRRASRKELEIVGRRLQGRGQGQGGRLLARLLAPDQLPDPRGDRDRARREGGQASRSRAPTSRRSGRRRPRSARCACPTPTRPRASSTPTKSSGARSERPAGSSHEPSASTQRSRGDRVRVRIRQRVRGDGGAAAPGRLQERPAHLRPGHRRRDRARRSRTRRRSTRA